VNERGTRRFSQAISEGDSISVLLVRNDQAKTFKVTLGDLPNA